MESDHWSKIRLENAVISIKGKKPERLEHVAFPGLVPYIDIEAFEKGTIKQYADTTTAKICSRGDVLVVWDGARFGLSATHQEGAIGSTLMALKPIVIESSFLLKFIQSKFEEIQQHPKGTGIPHINPDVFWNLNVPLPPLAEQKRIVEKLDAVLPRIKAVRERLDKILAILKRFRQSILADACSGRLTEDWRAENRISNDWKQVKLFEIGFMGRGKSRNRPRNEPKLYGGQYPFIQTGDIAQSNGYITSHMQTYNEIGLAQSKIWPSNTLCITIAANIANTAILTYPACFPDSVVGFIADENKCSVKFVKWSIDIIRNELASFAPETAQKNINIAILNEVNILLPHIEEQMEIVQRVEKLFNIADSLEAKHQKALQLIRKIEQSVLAKAFRGELAPQDPNDEPAAVLLERIKAEKKENRNRSGVKVVNI